jgi:dTDP-4-dehydrorhamnose 3,5-epimerase
MDALDIDGALGHAFVALSDQATVLYLWSTPYAPTREHGVRPLDPAIGIAWPEDMETIPSDKDRAAPHWRKRDQQGSSPTTVIAWPTPRNCAGPAC